MIWTANGSGSIYLQKKNLRFFCANENESDPLDNPVGKIITAKAIGPTILVEWEEDDCTT